MKNKWKPGVCFFSDGKQNKLENLTRKSSLCAFS